MALIKCPECGRENVSDSAISCPGCGYAIKKHFDDIYSENSIDKEIKSKNRLDKTYSVRIDNGKPINFPQLCTCCLSPTDKKQQIYSWYVEKKGMTKETRTINIDVPICDECLKHQHKYAILRKSLRWFAIICGILVGTYMTLNHYDDGLIPMVTWGVSFAMFFILTLVVRTKELPPKHTSRYESVTVTSPMLDLGLPISFVIFTFTNLQYAKFFQKANVNIAGDIKENIKTNTAKSINIFSVKKPAVMDFIFITIIDLIVMYIIDYLL